MVNINNIKENKIDLSVSGIYKFIVTFEVKKKLYTAYYIGQAKNLYKRLNKHIIESPFTNELNFFKYLYKYRYSSQNSVSWVITLLKNIKIKHFYFSDKEIKNVKNFNVNIEIIKTEIENLDVIEFYNIFNIILNLKENETILNLTSGNYNKINKKLNYNINIEEKRCLNEIFILDNEFENKYGKSLYYNSSNFSNVNLNEIENDIKSKTKSNI